MIGSRREDFDIFLHAILMTHPGLEFLLETQAGDGRGQNHQFLLHFTLLLRGGAVFRLPPVERQSKAHVIHISNIIDQIMIWPYGSS